MNIVIIKYGFSNIRHGLQSIKHPDGTRINVRRLKINEKSDPVILEGYYNSIFLINEDAFNLLKTDEEFKPLFNRLTIDNTIIII